VQYPGFHSFVAYSRRDSSYVTDVTHKFMMSLSRHQMSPRRLVPEAFQENNVGGCCSSMRIMINIGRLSVCGRDR
jgi:hypothetical protein